jgi:hypothetical protein
LMINFLLPLATKIFQPLSWKWFPNFLWILKIWKKIGLGIFEGLREGFDIPANFKLVETQNTEKWTKLKEKGHFEEHEKFENSKSYSFSNKTT